ncbi:hypothetical protein AMAG_20581 [Allomyces macrogynus ATCC 38327]|uniref:Uncharacterized protein n=1 Tax=Allomyces macrogynus (strain ATCC 38327) TaxID=578462 RepID=A0A0L0TDQ7_ALLM3|nr:hypothetical protein AMAG_20581 [Allomyces macrogynus ATCC 38327]|eukprot:KNE72815.1 hypothetical protein AMAG_20581 [Allomyces macrogynus ATCC 38327]
MAHPVPLTLTRNQNRDTPSPPPPPPSVFTRVPSRAEMARAPSRGEATRDLQRAPSRGALGDGAGEMLDLPPRTPSRADLRTPVAPVPRAPSRGNVRTPVTAAPLARAPSRAELVAAATAAAVARVPSRAELRTPIDPTAAGAGIARVPSRADGMLSTTVLPQRNASEAVQRYLASMASAADGVEDEGIADMDQLRAENRSLRLKLLHYEAAALSSSETSLVQQKADLAAQVLQLQQRVRDLERDKLALQSQLAAALTTSKDPLRTPTAPTFFDRPITPATTIRRGSESSTASSLRAPSPTPRMRAPTGPSSSALPTPTLRALPGPGPVEDAATRMRLARPSLRDLRSTAGPALTPATPASVSTFTPTTTTPRPGWLFGSAPRAPVRATAPLTPARTTPTAPRLIGAALGDTATPTPARIPPTTPTRLAPPPTTPSALGLLRPALATPPRTVESGAAALRRLLGVPDDADLDDDSISDESVLERHWRGRASIEPLALTAPPTDLAAVPDSPESRTVSTLSSPRTVPGSAGRGTRDRLRVRAAATRASMVAGGGGGGAAEDSVVFSEWDDADVTYLSNVALDLVSDRVVKVPRHAGVAAVVPETARVEEDVDVDAIVDRTPARASMVLPDITSPSLFRPLCCRFGRAWCGGARGRGRG